MSENIKIGLKNSVSKRVTEESTAAAFGTGALGVFSTPAMVSMMEEAAFLLLKNDPLRLDSVGTGLDIRHTRACLPGAEVHADAEIVGTDGRKVVFRVTAYDEEGEIGSGTHTRFVIDPERFMAKLKK